jgi:acetamidase/formamidase
MASRGRASASASDARPPEPAVAVAAVHEEWDARLEPAAVVQDGDRVRFSCPMGGDPRMSESSTLAEIDLDAFRFNLVGPVWVDGAQPGDTLEVEVLSVEPAEWGFTMIVPGAGLLPDDFPDAYLKTWSLRDGRRARLAGGVSVPLAPFLGTMGTQPDEGEPRSPLPPHRGGGNIDCRYLTAGARLWLPVWCRGARFSCGDGHAAQGDGEVCVSAIECAVEATLCFRLHRTSIATPRYAAPAPAVPAGTVHATMGIADDLMEGARTATRSMIEWLAERGLSREDAYVLLSVAGDLKILEVVDAGVWNVAMTLPLEVFE